MPCALVEKAIFGLVSICQKLLPHKGGLADELLRSLQPLLKLEPDVADAYLELITEGVNRLRVKANATRIRSQTGWRIITSLLSITAWHPVASRAGLDALELIVSDGAHLSPANYVLCIDAARHAVLWVFCWPGVPVFSWCGSYEMFSGLFVTLGPGS